MFFLSCMRLKKNPKDNNSFALVVGDRSMQLSVVEESSITPPSSGRERASQSQHNIPLKQITELASAKKIPAIFFNAILQEHTSDQQEKIWSTFYEATQSHIVGANLQDLVRSTNNAGACLGFLVYNYLVSDNKKFYKECLSIFFQRDFNKPNLLQILTMYNYLKSQSNEPFTVFEAETLISQGQLELIDGHYMATEQASDAVRNKVLEITSIDVILDENTINYLQSKSIEHHAFISNMKIFASSPTRSQVKASYDDPDSSSGAAKLRLMPIA